MRAGLMLRNENTLDETTKRFIHMRDKVDLALRLHSAWLLALRGVVQP
jgi:hypothetical protein